MRIVRPLTRTITTQTFFIQRAFKHLAPFRVFFVRIEPMGEELNIKEHIVEIDDETATRYTETELGQPLKSVKWFKKGYYSRAGLVQTKDGQKHVVRFGLVPDGYKKDKFASEHFSSLKVPVPGVKLIKQLDNQLWQCISEYAEGVHSDAIHGIQAKEAISSVQETLVKLHSTPIGSVSGFGDFDGDGKATYTSWPEYLNDDFCSQEFYDDTSTDTKLIRRAWDVIAKLAEMCPTDRFLVHNDFGSDNLLIKDGKVTAVLDWNFALLGDWVIDIASCKRYPLEVYGDLKQAHEKAGFDCSNWDVRISCYQLRSQIGLVHWLWERQANRLSKWQSIEDAQVDLKKMLMEAETNGSA